MIESLLKKLPWDKGRQGTGYSKIKLLESRRLKCDAYLLYYPTGSEIPPHTDKVESGRHYRLNIVLKQARKGGRFICLNPLISRFRVNLFRPDIDEHAVTKIEDGYRILFSVGWIR